MMTPVPHRPLRRRGRHTAHLTAGLGLLALPLCYGCGEATNNSLGVMPGHRSAALRDPAPTPDTEYVDVPWLAGEWHFLHDRSEVILIERTGPGQFTISPTKPESRLTKGSLNVLQVGCHRIAEMHWDVQQPDNVAYAILSGYTHRLSLDFVPAIFPAAWRDPQLLESLDLAPDQEVPPELRGRAIAWLADQIDAKGTLLLQDMTFYRPGTLD